MPGTISGSMRRSTPVRLAIDVEALLTSSGGVSAVKKYRPTSTIFSQGDPCEGVMYLRTGRVVLTVRSDAGREGVVAKLGPGQFFGEGCLTERPTRTTTATTTAASSVHVIETATMKDLLRREPRLADHFIAHMLATNIRIEKDLLGHLFNLDSTEKRLARILLRLADYGTAPTPVRRVRRAPKLSHARLAQLVGTRRARVDALMLKFQRLGFITEGRDMTVHPTLISVVLDD
jgi:CRP/FNR family transcriptional regulator, cyclic AMP receptor protein